MIPARASMPDPISKNTALFVLFNLDNNPDFTCPTPSKNILAEEEERAIIEIEKQEQMQLQ